MILFNSKEGFAAVFAIVIATVLLTASFYNTDAEVYLFPRITAILITFLASVLVFDLIKHKGQQKSMKRSLIRWKTLLPGFTVGVLYILLLEHFGFYACSFIAFLAICIIYGKSTLSDLKAFRHKLLITIIFMTVLYVLFWKLLHVRTPTGLFI